MMKKLGSDLLYLILKSIDRYNDPNIDGYVIHPNYLSVIIEDIEESTEEGLVEIKHYIKVELSEGSYLDNKNFLENLEDYFNENKCISDFKDCYLYKIILTTFNELKDEVESA